MSDHDIQSYTLGNIHYLLGSTNMSIAGIIQKRVWKYRQPSRRKVRRMGYGTSGHPLDWPNIYRYGPPSVAARHTSDYSRKINRQCTKYHQWKKGIGGWNN